LAQIVAIEAASFSDPWSARAFRDSLAATHVRVVVAELAPGSNEASSVAHSSIIAGYVVVLLVLDEGEIANIAVDARWQGARVGGALLDGALALARAADVRQFWLEVRRSNVRAQRLYRSRGFRETGRRPNYYTDPIEDGLVFTWRAVPPSLDD
jgi:ribosomal-protein-alanine N-acetyltransferase